MDAVIVWNNREDRSYQEKLKRYGVGVEIRGTESSNLSDAISPSEILLREFIKSLNRFAPFFRRIFILTNGQDPRLGDFLSSDFERPIPIELVDHKDLFKGYEALLPTFNLLALETMIWAINGLSEQFVYYPNLTPLVKPANTEDFFDKNGNPVWDASKQNIFFTTIKSIIGWGRNRNRHPFLPHFINSAGILGKKAIYIPRKDHFPLLKSVFKEYFDFNREVMEENISYRFPDKNQFSPIQLFALLAPYIK